MNKWKKVTVTVATASVLLLGIPAAGIGAQESVNYSIFDYASTGVLKEGSRGENVKIMQRALNKAMGAELTEDGVFGPNTKTAVLAFQKSHKHLANDGVYGPQTHATLSKQVNSFGFADSTLRLGSRGEAVKTLQKGLNDMSYNVTVDGVYGPKTKAAVIKFQERFPELANDGIFGPKTKNVMDKVLND
ncbi:peptidoglycan-binding domain-containing protein [Alkalihalobacterium elongatum]|uniref:peptidoglycan-binding domain-containing protein n=1 Tax=Alkalihalobacterium elongatum TaxID=2675466 RepID=UPI001C1F4DE9|nr:peptidoglycan-binding protein [Alkalihalobacterium elongatum]